MARKLFKKEEEEQPEPTPEPTNEHNKNVATGGVREVVITQELLNAKLNYIISVMDYIKIRADE